MSGSVNQELIIRRRVIRAADLELIRQLIVTEGAQGRSHLSNRLCELWNWRHGITTSGGPPRLGNSA